MSTISQVTAEVRPDRGIQHIRQVELLRRIGLKPTPQNTYGNLYLGRPPQHRLILPHQILTPIGHLEATLFQGLHTGGKGSLTQQAHCEFIVGSETIRPHFTWWVHAGYCLKVPTNSPPKNPPQVKGEFFVKEPSDLLQTYLAGTFWVLFESTHQFTPTAPSG